MKEIAESEKYLKLRDHEFLFGVINIIRNGKDDDDFWEYIDSKVDWEYYPLPKLPNTATATNLYIYILSGISWAAKNILDKNGLILFFNEAESLDENWFHTYYRKMRDKDFLKGLVLVTSNDKVLLEENISIRKDIGGKIGEKTQLRYYGYSIKINGQSYDFVRFAWKIPSYIKTVFAFTPGSVAAEENLSNANKLVLSPLNTSELKKIADRLSRIYLNAYGFSLNGLNRYNLMTGDEQTRLSIKRFVEKLDIERFNAR